MRKVKTWYMTGLLALVLIVGCAQQPISQQLSNTQGQISQYRARTSALVDAKAISKADAQERLDNIVKAQKALDAARLAWSTCLANSETECTEAADLAAGAQSILGEVEAFLIKKEAGK